MKKIVTIGGGTGSFTILSGLKNISDVDLTAIVSMADDGGSTGVLRDELGVLPPGDIRQCLVALSEHTDVVRRLMSYRFAEGGLAGHSFGNILLAALEKVTGNFAEGVAVASDILKVRGTVLPVTQDNTILLVELEDGTIFHGENAINHTDMQAAGIKRLYYEACVTLNSRVEIVLGEADVIIIGPGNYYCSVLPNLVVPRMIEVLQHTPAKIIFPVNLTNKKGHTEHWKVSDYVHNLETILKRKVDIILINNNQPSKEQVNAYALEEGDGVMVIDDMNNDSRTVRAPLLSNQVIEKDKSDTIAHSRSFIRHDSTLFASAIEKLII